MNILKLLNNGKKIDICNLKIEDIDVDCIAHALAKQDRYAGHLPIDKNYSVAEHAVLGVELLKRLGCSKNLQKMFLHHDDTECFIEDISSPLKKQLRIGNQSMKEFENDILEKICDKFILPHTESNLWEIIHNIDHTICGIEMAKIFNFELPNFNKEWLNYGFELQFWTPIEAKEEYLKLHYNLIHDTQGAK